MLSSKPSRKAAQSNPCRNYTPATRRCRLKFAPLGIRHVARHTPEEPTIYSGFGTQNFKCSTVAARGGSRFTSKVGSGQLILDETAGKLAHQEEPGIYLGHDVAGSLVLRISTHRITVNRNVLLPQPATFSLSQVYHQQTKHSTLSSALTSPGVTTPPVPPTTVVPVSDTRRGRPTGRRPLADS